MHSMWTHFVSLVWRSWESFRNSLGTTSLGFIAPLIVSLISIVTTLYYILRQHGRDAMLRRWKEDAAIALRVTAVVTVFVYGPIFIYQGVVKTIYEDHRSLVGKNEALSSRLAVLEAETNDNKHFLDVLQAFTVYRLRM